MNTYQHLLGAWAAAAIAVTLANPAAAQTRPAVAGAGSAYVVPGGYMQGTVTNIDTTGHTITIGIDTYPVWGTNTGTVRVGDVVNVTFVMVHYGPAAYRAVLGVERRDDRD